MAGETKGCVFCEIVAGRAPAYRVFENTHALVILDIQPFTEGHCLVLSKRHTTFWHELSAEENVDLFAAANTVANRMMTAWKPDFVCLYARGRRIPHTHVFLLPTYGGDVLDRATRAEAGRVFESMGADFALARLVDHIQRSRLSTSSAITASADHHR